MRNGRRAAFSRENDHPGLALVIKQDGPKITRIFMNVAHTWNEDAGSDEIRQKSSEIPPVSPRGLKIDFQLILRNKAHHIGYLPQCLVPVQRTRAQTETILEVSHNSPA